MTISRLPKVARFPAVIADQWIRSCPLIRSLPWLTGTVTSWAGSAQGSANSLSRGEGSSAGAYPADGPVFQPAHRQFQLRALSDLEWLLLTLASGGLCDKRSKAVHLRDPSCAVVLHGPADQAIAASAEDAFNRLLTAREAERKLPVFALEETAQIDRQRLLLA